MKDTLYTERQVALPMSSQDFKKLGEGEVGYMKKYSVKGQAAWVLHAADGTALAVQPTEDAALQSAQHHELELVPLN